MPVPYRRVLTLPFSRSKIIQWVDAAALKDPKKTKTTIFGYGRQLTG